MEFWRIYRLIYAKRWLILATIIIAALVILIGTSLQAQKREYEATAVLQPQNNTLPDVIARTTEGGNASSAPASNAQDSSATVSDVIMILRNSQDLYNKTADLLKEDEGLRTVEVQRILDRNAYFSSVDNEIQLEANRRVKKGDLTPEDENAWIAKNKQAARTHTINQLAKGRDASGAFAAAGLSLTEEEIADRIRDRITFDTVPGPLSTDTSPQISDQIQVTAKFDREAEAVLYENLLCIEFLDYYTNKATSGVNAKIALLNEMLETANTKLQHAKQEEAKFRRASGVLLTAATDPTVNRAQALQTQRDEAEREFKGADAAVAQLQTLLQSVQPTRTSVLPPEENPEVRALRNEVDQANVAFEVVKNSNADVNLDRYKAAHDRLTAAKKQLQEALARQYTTTTTSTGPEELQSKLNSALVARQEAQQHLLVANSQLDAQHAEMANVPAADNRLSDLRREIALSDQNVRELETTRDRMMEYGVEHGRAGTINIVSTAHPTPIVSRIAAQRGKLIIYGMALALFFGIVLVVAMDALDNSIRSAEDVEKLTGLPIAGIIPEHLPDPARSPRMALIDPLSAATEAYRMLRTYLLFTEADRPFHSLLMATAKPGQGSTTTLSNLAIVLAQSGRRVILVDADLRHPKLDRIFRRSNDVGLTTVLMNRCPVEDALLSTEVEGLTLLPAGPFVNNPSELLGSTRMHNLHEHLKSMADFVLFDTPSAISYADTAVLSSFLDATLMVVRADGVPRGTEHQVQSMLMKAKANLIGAVLNGVVPERVDSVHFHEAYYPALTAVGPSYLDDKSAAAGERSILAGYSARNGSSAKADEALAIALPDNSRNFRNGVATTAVVPVTDEEQTDEPVTEEPDRASARVVTDPFNISSQSAPAAAAPTLAPSKLRLDQEIPTQGIVAKKRQVFQMKAVILVIIAGLVLGIGVLILSSGANVK